MAMAMFADMCGYSRGKILYENKENTKVKIVEKYYGCGATDSTPATPSTFKQREVLSIFIIKRRIDIKSLDMSKWIEK